MGRTPPPPLYNIVCKGQTPPPHIAAYVLCTRSPSSKNGGWILTSMLVWDDLPNSASGHGRESGIAKNLLHVATFFQGAWIVMGLEKMNGKTHWYSDESNQSYKKITWSKNMARAIDGVSGRWDGCEKAPTGSPPNLININLIMMLWFAIISDPGIFFEQTYTHQTKKNPHEFRNFREKIKSKPITPHSGIFDF